MGRRGYTCVLSVEKDMHAAGAYLRNFDELPKLDIRDVKNHEIPNNTDILCAGFPCQSFSLAGKRKGFEDERGSLFFEVVRFIKAADPTIVLLENVTNLLNIDGGLAISEIVESIENLGYDLYYNVLNASHYGIPQSRKRLYFVGVRRYVSLPDVVDYIAPAPNYKQVKLRDVLEDEVDESLFISDIYNPTWTGTDPICNVFRPVRLGHYASGGQGQRIYSVDGHAVTQSALGGGQGAKTGLYKVGDRVRKLSLTECKRVMGFPDDWKISEGRHGYKQLGNAVIPAMVENVLNGINALNT